MSQDKSVSEPSMEEILSSIRRIIADEDKAPPPAAPGTAAGEDDVLELTTVAEDDAESGSAAPAKAPGPAPAGGEPAPAPATAKALPDPKEAASSGEPLVSAAAAAASMSAFAKLARPIASEPPAATGGITVEALVIQLLRPALREWLDANLPPLVERIVEQEVRKLARRAEIQ